MSTLAVTLGARGPEPAILRVAVDVPEFDPEAVFVACNRIISQEEDLLDLRYLWQRALRISLDLHRAPSMSTGDSFTLTSPQGRMIGTWVCEMSGWTFQPAQRQEVS